MISASCLYRVKVWLALAAVLGTLPHQVSADSEARHKLAAPDWRSLHLKNKQEAAELVNQGKVLDVVFYGDSITEAWRETNMGLPHKPFRGIRAVWERHFGHLEAANFGIAGDSTEVLMYRLRSGELPKGLQARNLVVLIGTNDLHEHRKEMEYVETISDAISGGILSILAEIQRAMPAARVIVLGLLPRGSYVLDPDNPNNWIPSMELSHYFMPVLERVNEKVRLAALRDGSLVFVNCGGLFLREDNGQIDEALMPDALHPSPSGMDLLASCLKPHLRLN